MKLTKQLEAEIKKLYLAYWDSYLLGDVEKCASLLAEDFTLTGSAENEIINNKKEATAFFKATVKEVVGNVEFRNRRFKISLTGSHILLREYSDLYINDRKEWVFYSKFRMSSLYNEERGKWKIIHQHGSVPDHRIQGNETIAFRKIIKENIELRDAVKRRTVELENKNRELEVESSLERVRTVAMAMKKPEDMLVICKTISGQLAKLGVENIRNVQTAIFNKNGTYMNYEYYAKHRKTIITEVDYKGNYVHKDQQKFARTMMSRKGAFYTQSFIGKQLKDWYAYQKTTNQLADKFLQKAHSLNYYWFSLGPVALGISTYYPLTKEQIELFKRFENVFGLAYRRYLDIEKAGAQAREAQVEASLEKVRAQAMGMRKPDDMLTICREISRQLTTLSVQEVRNVQTAIFYPKRGSYMNYQYYSKSRKTFITDTVYTNHRVARDFAALMLKGKGQVSITHIEGRKKVNDWIRYQKKTNVFIDPWLYKASSLHYYWYSLGPVALGISTYRRLTNSEEILFRRFLKVFELAYRRYLDIEKAEAQAREAQIETALEKVRSRSLAMQKSDELKEVIRLVLTEIRKLGILAEHAGFYIDYKMHDDMHIWLADPNIEPFFAILPYFDTPTWKSFVEAKAKGTTFHTDLLDFKEKNKFYKSLFKLFTVPEKAKQFYLQCKGLAVSTVLLDNVGLYIENFSGTPYPEEENNILMRFGRVFQQTYTRFLDLQKAEAQAREAQIEAALERVRSRSMAMHNSQELEQVIKVLTDQLSLLGFRFHTANFITNESMPDWEIWISAPGQENIPPKIHVPYIDHPLFNERNNAILKGKDMITAVLDKKEKNRFFRHMLVKTAASSTPEARKKWIYEQKGLAITTVPMKTISFSVINYDAVPYSPEENEVIRRMARVFEQSYTRFLDLQKAEAQAREAQIEAGLERVRSKTMAMHKSEEVTSVALSLNEELLKLGFEGGSTIIIIDKATGDTEQWTGFSQDKFLRSCYVPFFKHPYHTALVNAWKKQEKYLVHTVAGAQKKLLDDHYFSTGYTIFPEKDKKWMREMRTVTFSHAFMKYGAIHWGPGQLNEEQLRILLRFAKVFEQSYTRFLDLQKAEVQAKEAQVELGLERVRARAMAMQNSGELAELVSVVFKELTNLGFALTSCIIWISDKETSANTLWVTSAGMNKPAEPVQFQPFHHPFFHSIIHAWKKSDPKWIFTLSGREKKSFEKSFFADRPGLPLALKNALTVPDKVVFSASFNNFGALEILGTEPLTDEKFDILHRFGKVFNTSYTRFNDLKKAEAQARESQIQLAFERVRARTMAMQKSQELPEAATLLFNQVQTLGMPAFAAGYCIWEDDKRAITLWMSSEGILQPPFKAPTTEDELFIQMRKGYEDGRSLHVVEMGGKELVAHYRYMRTLPVVGDIFDSILEAGHQLPVFQVMHYAYFSKGFLLFITYEPVPDAHDIFIRFGKVFEQTYTRFLDLQKAEAQARESQVQLALERVRARTMAMQKSDELRETSHLLFDQLKELGEPVEQLTIGIVHEEDNAIEVSVTLHGDVLKQAYSHSIDEPYIMNKVYNGWKKQQKTLVVELTGNELNAYNRYRNELTGTNMFPTNLTDEHRRIIYTAFFSKGMLALGANEPRPTESLQLLERFAQVFDLTYTRFLDLKKAEAQSRESQIQLALERVRARTMAMYKSEELAEVVALLHKQFEELDFGLYQILISIINTEKNCIEWWSRGFGRAELPQCNIIPFIDHPFSNLQREKWESRIPYHAHILEGEIKRSWEEYLFTQTDLKNFPAEVKKQMQGIERVYLSDAFMKYGVLQAAGPAPLPDDKADILIRFAKVLDQAYTRMKDLQKAEAQAKEAQIEASLERVRSQTMAMHKSEELLQVISTVSEQLEHLQFRFHSVSFVINSNEYNLDYWLASPGQPHPFRIHVPYLDNPVITRFRDARSKGIQFFADVLTQKENLHWIQHMLENSDLKNIPDSDKQYLMSRQGLARSVVITRHIALTLLNYASAPYSDEQNEILKRFANVFEQSYTRFLDLQKAEVQAREAQVEAALERVRSRSLAMHKSEELADLSLELVKQVQALGVKTWFCAFNIYDNDPQGSLEWGSNGEVTFPRYRTPREGVFLRYYEAGQRGEILHINKIGEDECPAHYDYLCSLPGLGDQLLKMKAAGIPFPDSQIDHVAFFKYGYLLFISYEPVPESHDIFKRFAKVFEQTYTRFLDLKKAEAQAREAQIEASLERIRAKAMAMHHSDELDEVLVVLWEQFDILGIRPMSAHMTVVDIPNNRFTFRETGKFGNRSFGEQVVDIDAMDIWKEAAEQWRRSEPETLNRLHFPKESLPMVWQVFHQSFSSMPEDSRITPDDYPDGIYHIAGKHPFGYIGINQIRQATEEEEQIVIRFASEFGRAYQRFLDLQKAEKQAREAQIEASLERVRSKTMAMHNSEDVGQTVATMVDEFKKLGIETMRCGIGIMHPDYQMEVWTAKTNEQGEVDLIIGQMNMSKHPLLAGNYETWANKKESFSYLLEGDDLVAYYTAINNDPEYPIKYDISLLPPRIFQNDFHFNEGTLYVFSVDELSPEAKKIFTRFSAVFGQTYRRYLDLQKAEAQAREAQIEASLERVRSKTMAMHNSVDVGDTVASMFAEFMHLGIRTNRCGILIFNDDTTAEVWTARSNPDGKANLIIGRLNLEVHNLLTSVYHAWMDKLAIYRYDMTGEDLVNYYKAINDSKFYPTQFDLGTLPEKEFHSDYFFQEGAVFAFTSEPIAVEHSNIFKRFAAVFGQTYRRYLDLQKAEAQARESQIEAGLERVRSRTLAMHRSDELAETAAVMFRQLIDLGIAPSRLYITLIKDTGGEAEFWITDEDGAKVSMAYTTNMNGNPTFKKMFQGWREKKQSQIIDMEGEELQEYFRHLTRLNVPFKGGLSQKRRVQHIAYFGNGFIGMASPEEQPPATLQLLERFAAAFNLTYTRFHDLQIAEAQTQKAKIETALEKVRARALAMQQPEELMEVTAVLREEMGMLGVEELETSSIFIYNDDDTAEIWFAIKHPGQQGPERVSDHFSLDMNRTVLGRDMLRFYKSGGMQTSILMKGEERREWMEYCFSLSSTLRNFYQGQIEERIYHICKFSHGAIVAATNSDISPASWDLLKRTASVFSLAYSRFKDLTQARLDLQRLKEEKQRAETALSELQVTQKQLIQSEKMASLGELTAGIAHEIQNPLNFVNNFSEVSKELLDEMRESFEKGDMEDARVIMNDVIQNLEKINHHGKRADGIVKGMLQHSRSSSGQKELTDINALADEYLRLAYHGLRAKDKSFNAKFDTGFDETVEKISVMPQDFGRVILNLINNAFYAVSERKKQGVPGYEPTVTVSTRKEGDRLLLSVKDNGNGIPQHVMDKIFQPFFTTKPTGQGTGLGLSLSYDIVKAHGGEMKVETKENEGTVFIIQLPVKAEN